MLRLSAKIVGLSLATAFAATIGFAAPALADPHHWHGGGFHDHDRFRHGPSFGFFFGPPAVIAPPPVVYAPAYPGYVPPYAPVPVSGVYMTAYGYCRDYRTGAGIETACQQPDG